MTITLLNLTPHPLVLMLENGVELELPVAGEPARVLDHRRAQRSLDTDVGPVELADVDSRSTEVVGLPPPRDGVVFVVSRVTATAVDRADVVFPLDEVRDEAKRIIGCRGLGRFVSR